MSVNSTLEPDTATRQTSFLTMRNEQYEAERFKRRELATRFILNESLICFAIVRFD